MDNYSFAALALLALVYSALLIIPVAKILGRAGLNPWWSLLAPVPFLHLFLAWLFALCRWPSRSRRIQEVRITPTGIPIPSARPPLERTEGFGQSRNTL